MPQNFRNFQEFLQELRMTEKQKVFMEQMFKECVLHDMELLFSNHIVDDESKNPRLLLWRPTQDEEPVQSIYFKIQKRFVQVTPTELSSTGLLMRFIISVYVKEKYQCPYCHRKRKKVGYFIEMCSVCLQSCCPKCREGITHCNNCKKQAGHYSLKFDEV